LLYTFDEIKIGEAQKVQALESIVDFT